ncbi:MAG: hypothetical protein IT368_04445 [Candidatus Hydrogenedentes bacterium]|nr:hypothetical protein [Candidatus Hydrogenedentota bacterium]
MDPLYLGFEGGGSKTRVMLADARGAILAHEVGGPASALYVSPTQFRKQVETLLRPIRKTLLRVNGRLAAAAIAGPMNREIAAEVIHRRFGRVRIHELSEGETALCSHHLTTGIAIIAGTGSSAFALRDGQAAMSCGGFGPQFGDEGSAYWIGREALAAAARAGEGRGPATALHRLVLDHFGVRSFRDLYAHCDANGHIFAPAVAGLATFVGEAALRGDAVAAGILRAAGRALAEMAIALHGRAGFGDDAVALVPAGGVFRAGDHVIRPLRQALHRSQCRFELYPPVLEPVDGLVHYLLMRYEAAANPATPGSGSG